MFTVKHISLSGIERVNLATEVTFWPQRDPGTSERSISGKEEIRPRVDYTEPHGHSSYHIDGTIFVMNDKGATVSRWDLGASPVPLRDDVTGQNVRTKIGGHPQGVPA